MMTSLVHFEISSSIHSPSVVPQLLTVLLQHNPFMGSLNPEPYQKKLAHLYESIRKNIPARLSEYYEQSIHDAVESDNSDTSKEVEMAVFQAIINDVNDEKKDANEIPVEEKEFVQMVDTFKFTQSVIDFIDIYESAAQSFQSMLLSSTASDVTETLRFIVQARHFQLPYAVSGMKRALALMWSSEQSIREEVIKTFVEVFLAQPGSEGEVLLPAEVIAKNLLSMTNSATPSELASIEEGICHLIRSERIPAEVYSVLWTELCRGNVSRRATSMQLIAMGAAADRSIVDNKSRLKLLLDEALGEIVQESRAWQVVSAAATALQRVEKASIDPSDAKYLVLERIIEELCAVIRGDWCNDNDANDTQNWLSAAEQSIKALFTISSQPEVVCRSILLAMSHSTLISNDGSVHPMRLSRLFHVMGQVAMNVLVYTEALSVSLRRANTAKALKAQENATSSKRGNRSTTDTPDDDDNAIEEELGMAAEAEAESERMVADILESEILSRGILSHFVPLLLSVVGNTSQVFSNELLRQTATLALCKCMCVSRSFCEEQLPLLFTALSCNVLQDSSNRSNIVVALGDLAFRFPNEVDPYTSHMYSCLRDSSIKVRRHTLMVLSHLILNDMVKVKGQVCEIALCLQDDDPRIRDMSRFLFQELSKRSNNPIYNLLPDIVSQLSQLPDYKEDFRTIMSFLFSFISKERQNEVLTDKLCQRFLKCETIGQKADIAFCLAQLKVTEKSFKILLDNFRLYKDCLHDDDVRKSFAAIVAKAKKSLTKPECKQSIEDWEIKLNAEADLGSENQATQEAAVKVKSKVQKRAARQRKAVLSEITEFENVQDVADDDSSESSNDTPMKSP
jgi:condensin complex subunit 1